jgi:hypothetical protein
MALPLPPQALVLPPMESTCLIGADGLDFISVNPLTRTMFLHKISGTDAGQLSPKHSQNYYRIKTLFTQHLLGNLTKNELLECLFKKEEIEDMERRGVFIPTLDNISME